MDLLHAANKQRAERLALAPVYQHIFRLTLMQQYVALALVSLVCAGGLANEIGPQPSGNAVIRGTFGSSEIVITTTDRLAGAIHSLRWNGSPRANRALVQVLT